MQKRLYCSPEKKICGVCGGIADYFNIDPTIVRLIAALVALYTAVVPFFIAYLIMALIIPQPTPEYEQMFHNTSRRIYKSNDKKIAGVCGGIADFFGVDPTIVRLVFFLLVLLFGTGVAAYIVCAIIFPPAPQEATYQDYGYGQPYTPPQDAAYEQPQQEQPQADPQPAANDAQPPVDEQPE